MCKSKSVRVRVCVQKGMLTERTQGRGPCLIKRTEGERFFPTLHDSKTTDGKNTGSILICFFLKILT